MRSSDSPWTAPGGGLEVDVPVEVGERLVEVVPRRGEVQEAARRGRCWRPGSRGTSVGLTFSSTTSASMTHLLDVVAAREVVHDVEQHLFEDGPQAAGAGAPQQRLVGDRVEGVVGELELDVFELEELLVLLDQAFLGSVRISTSASGRGCRPRR
jgi:hypothetical protein